MVVLWPVAGDEWMAQTTRRRGRLEECVTSQIDQLIIPISLCVHTEEGNYHYYYHVWAYFATELGRII